MDKCERRRVSRMIDVLWSLPVLLVLFWECAAVFGFLNPICFPRPSKVLQQVFTLCTCDTVFIQQIGASMWRFCVGYVIAMPVAFVLGVVLAFHARLRKMVLPFFSLTYPIPKLAIFPLLMVIFGIDDAPKIAVIAIGIFYLVFYHVFHSVQKLHWRYFIVAILY